MRSHCFGSAVQLLAGLLLFTLASTGNAEGQDLTLADHADKRVLQRQPSAGGFTSSLAIGGSISGPGGVEARAIDAQTGAAVTAWTIVDPTPLEGIWTGTLPDVPEGGWYRVEVRAESDPTSITSEWRFGVGLVIAALGQSNMARLFTEDEADGSLLGPAETPRDLTWRFGYGEPPGYEYERPRDEEIPVSWGPVTGSGGIRLANRIQAAVGLPVLILDFALDWTGIDRHWNEIEEPFVGWARFVAALEQTGGVEAILWHQGTYDAVTNPSLTAEQYGAGLDRFYQRLHDAIAPAEELPFVIALQNRGDYTRDTTLDASFAAVRRAQARWIAENGFAYSASTSVDLDISTRTGTGQGHFWAANYQEMGERFAAGTLHALGVSTESVEGGEIESATIDGQVIEVRIRHDRGSRLSLPIPEQDIAGFEVTDGFWESAELPIERSVLTDSGEGNRVLLVLGRQPQGPVRLRYLYGQNPNRRESERSQRRGRGNWLYDDATYAPGRAGLPVRATEIDIEVTGAGPRDLSPAALDDRAFVASGGEVGLRVVANDLDPEGALDPGSVTLFSSPAHGTITQIDTTTGTLTYVHDGSGSNDSFTYAVADAGGNLSAVATVRIETLDPTFPALGGRVLHLESDRGLEVAVGGRVAWWNDLSGRGNHLEGQGDPQAGTSGPNDRPAVLFDGTGDRLERVSDLAALPAGVADRSLFAVVQYRDTGFGGIAYGSTTEGASCAVAGNRTFGLVVDPSGDLTIQTWCTDLRSTFPGTNAGWISHSAVVQDSLLHHYSDGELIDLRAHTFATDGEGSLVMGAEIDNNPHLPMDVAALLVYDRALSEPERLRIETYLQTKYLVPPGTQGPPTAVDDLVVISRGETAEILVLANDHADGFLDPTSVTLVEQPTAGSANVDPDSGRVTYHHGGSEETDDQLTYTVADTLGRISEPATVTIRVLPFSLPTAGLALHLESDRGVGTTGSTVTAWNDQSGNGNHLGTQGNPSLAPGGPGGLSYLRLDGNDDRLLRSGLSGLPGGASDRSMFAVLRYRSTGFGGVSYGTTSCDQVFGLIVDPSGRLGTQGWCNDYPSPAPGTGTGWLVQSSVLAAGDLLQYRDGARLTLDSDTSITTDGAGTLMIGAEIDGDPAVALDTAAVLLYDRVLAPAERLAVETYLQRKYLGSDAPTPPPVAIADQALVAMGGEVRIDLLANDLDDEGLDRSSVTLLTLPVHGEVTVLADGIISYRHRGDSLADDSWTYTVRDVRGLTSEPTVVTVRPQPPELITDGLVLRLEATAGVETQGTEVTAWRDLSGSTNDLFPGGDPRLLTEPPGRTFLRLDGGNDKLERLSGLVGLPGGNADRTLFTVVRYHGPGFGGVSFGSPQCNGVFGTIVDNRGAPGIQGWCQGNDFLVASETVTGQGWQLQAARLESDTLEHYLGSRQIDSAEHVFDTDGGGRLRVGAEIDGQPFVEMDVSAILLWDRALSEPERLAIEGYLRRGFVDLPVTPPRAEDDFAAVTPADEVVIPVLANDADDQGIDFSSLRVETPPNAGTVLVDPNAGTLTYRHDGSPSPRIDTFTYTVANVAGLVSDPATVTVQILDGEVILSGLVLHLETDDGPVTSAGSVIAWNDLSGHGNHLRAEGTPVLVEAALNGRDVVRFDGIDDVLLRTEGLEGLPTGSADRSVFLVVSYESTGFGGFAWGRPTCNGVFGTVVDGRGDLAVQGWCAENDFSSPTPGSGTGWCLQEAVLQDDSLTQHVDGALVESSNHVFATGEGGEIVLGAEIDGRPFLRMDVAAVLVYDRALSLAERRAVERYLGEKYLGVPPVGGPGPRAVDDLAWVEPGSTDEVPIGVLGNDSAPAGLEPTTVQIVDLPTAGSVRIDPQGVVLYSHGGGSALRDSFRYTVADLEGTMSEPATVYLTVSPPLPVQNGLVLHLETDFGTAPTLGDRVITWLDLSPLRNDLVASGNPALVSANLGGRDTLRFDGAGDLLQNLEPLSGLPTGNQDRTLLAVVRYRGDGFGGITWGAPACNQAFGAVVDNRGQLAVQGWCTGNDFLTSTAGVGAGWRIQSVTLEGSQLLHHADGTLIDDTRHDFDTAPGGSLVVGAEIDGSPQVPMDLAAILIFDRALSDTERRQLEGYLREKYGLSQPAPPAPLDPVRTALERP